MVGKRGKILDLRMLVDTRQSTWKTFSVCKRGVNIYLLPLIRTCLERLLYRSNSVLLLCSLGGPFLLWLWSCLSWLQYPFETSWTLRIFTLSPQMCAYSDWASCCRREGHRMFPWGPLDDHPPFGFLPTCRRCRLEHSSWFGSQTFCSWAFDMSHLRSWGRMTLLCSRRGLGW